MDSLKDKLWYLLHWRIRYFFISIKNLIRWFPVIWNDRDWDSAFIFYILRFKLLNQAKYIGDRKFHMDSEKDARNMRICVALIDKIESEFYQNEYMDYHVSEYNWIPADKWVPIGDDLENIDVDHDENFDFKRLEILLKEESFDLYFAKYKRAYKEVTKTETYIFRNDTKNKIAMNISFYNHNKARKLLFKILESQIERWWD
jgi:hypothetical protein